MWHATVHLYAAHGQTALQFGARLVSHGYSRRIHAWKYTMNVQ